MFIIIQRQTQPLKEDWVLKTTRLYVFILHQQFENILVGQDNSFSRLQNRFKTVFQVNHASQSMLIPLDYYLKILCSFTLNITNLSVQTFPINSAYVFIRSICLQPRCSKGLVLVYSLTLLKIVTDHHLVVCLESLFCEPINQKLNIYNSNGVKCAHVSFTCL